MDFTRFMDFYNESDYFSIRQGIRLTKLSAGYAEAEVDAGELHRNLHGCVHGGLLFTLGDIAAGCCLSTSGYKCVTLSASANFIRSGFRGRLRAEAQAVRMGKRIGVSDVCICDASDTLLFRGTYTMMFKESLSWQNEKGDLR